MMSPPVPQHAWLKQLIGNWKMEAECMMGPDQPPSKTTGTETVRAFGDMWVICEGEGEMPGGAGTMQSRMTLGFDPAKNAYIGTWLGQCMPLLFVYEGTIDAAKPGILPLNTMGPSWADPTKMVRYQDVIEIQSPDRRLLWSQVEAEPGQWMRFMTATYTRVK
jgi:hypothetical protein